MWIHLLRRPKISFSHFFNDAEAFQKSVLDAGGFVSVWRLHSKCLCWSLLTILRPTYFQSFGSVSLAQHIKNLILFPRAVQDLNKRGWHRLSSLYRLIVVLFSGQPDFSMKWWCNPFFHPFLHPFMSPPAWSCHRAQQATAKPKKGQRGHRSNERKGSEGMKRLRAGGGLVPLADFTASLTTVWYLSTRDLQHDPHWLE